jgi:hypothetical protein
MRSLLVALCLLLIVAPAFGQSAPETLTVDAPAGVTACEIEQSKDAPIAFAVVAPRVAPTGAQCVFTITPTAGRTLYRWAQFYGTTRVLRTDAGVYLCVGLADCPLAPTNVGVK